MFCKKKSLLVGIGLMLPFAAFAQENAGQLEKRFEKLEEPKSVQQPLVFPLQEQLPPEQAAQVRFILKQLVFSGNTAFSSPELEALASAYLGKEISLIEIYRLRDAITQKYGDAGFGLTKAIVPPQRIQNEGNVQIQILEGFIDDVIIEGASTEQQAYLAHAAEKLKAERPLNAKTLERYLLLANDRFAIKVTSTLRQSEKTPNASTLILKVENASLLDGGVSLDNRGTLAVGRVQANAEASLNGLLGRASRSTVGYATVEQGTELQYWSLSHTEVISNEGSSLIFGYTNSASKPGTSLLRRLSQQSTSEGWAATLAHPFIRTRQENLTARVKYDQRDVESEALKNTTSLDRLRSIRFGFSYDNADRFDGINQVLFETSFGLNSLGATDNNSPLKSRADGKIDYRKVTLNLSRTQQLAVLSPALSQLSVHGALMGQYSGSGLLSTEECGIGGSQFGRGYDFSEILGDSCAAGSLELRYAINTQGAPLKYAQLYSFYDGGMTANHNALNATDKKVKSLTSAGLGIRFGLWSFLNGSLELAKPLTRDVANEGDRNTRLFASISARF